MPDQYKYETLVRIRAECPELGADLDARLARVLARLKEHSKGTKIHSDTSFYFPSHPIPVGPAFLATVESIN